MTAKLSPSDATALVESYRVKLGFLPWHEQEQIARIRFDGRRSGRTTHTILCALARAATFPGDRVVLSADPSFVDYLRSTTQGIAKLLGLDALSVEIVSHAKTADRDRWRGHDNVRFFSDHFDAQREQIRERFRQRRAGRP
jgi:hypothetical protein